MNSGYINDSDDDLFREMTPNERLRIRKNLDEFAKKDEKEHGKINRLQNKITGDLARLKTKLHIYCNSMTPYTYDEDDKSYTDANSTMNPLEETNSSTSYGPTFGPITPPKATDFRRDFNPSVLPEPLIKNVYDLNINYEKHLSNHLEAKIEPENNGLDIFTREAIEQFRFGKIKLPKKTGILKNESDGIFNYAGSYDKMISDIARLNTTINNVYFQKAQLRDLYNNCFVIPHILYSNKLPDNIKFRIEIINTSGKIMMIDEETRKPIVMPFHFKTLTMKDLEIEIILNKNGSQKQMTNWKMIINKGSNKKDGTINNFWKFQNKKPKVIYDLNKMDYLLTKKDILARTKNDVANELTEEIININDKKGQKLESSKIKLLVDKLINGKKNILRDMDLDYMLKDLRKRPVIKTLVGKISGGTRKLVPSKQNKTRKNK